MLDTYSIFSVITYKQMSSTRTPIQWPRVSWKEEAKIFPTMVGLPVLLLSQSPDQLMACCFLCPVIPAVAAVRVF